MDEFLKLPVTYNGKSVEYPFKIVAQGFLTRYVVLVDTIKVVIERDDKGELRAIIYEVGQITAPLLERGLLEVITSVIAQLTE